ncbi:DUF805 domain-containing protein [Paenibacillus sinopodophylli]|uniref:DUF805 domain-containing protein n=1 Tax=Paenibacillus sinopodophylli TaxID=1837342 RepID=UPI00110D016F|nr:DUF805 domain-containing protein [Paenibacillus sinopodophylli]
MQWYLKAIKNYAGVDGRSRRMEFWMFFLINFLITMALAFVESLIGLPSLLSGLYTLAIIVPSIAVTVRRLHDIGKSGGWIFIGLVPAVGWIILLVFFIMEGESINKYGRDPKLSAN